MEHFSDNDDFSKNVYVQIIDQINGKDSKRKEKNDANKTKNNSRKCSKFNYVAKNKSNLRIHQCNRTSPVTSGLKQNLKTQTGQRSNKCNQCDFASSHASHLKIHLKTHTGEKPNKCNQCDYTCSDPSALRSHLKRHTGSDFKKCNFCEYGSIYSGNLKTHLKTHSEERSYKCNHCNFASIQAGNLKTHLRTHTGEKPNKCNQCDYVASRRDHLERHLRVHNGEKLYKCKKVPKLRPLKMGDDLGQKPLPRPPSNLQSTPNSIISMGLPLAHSKLVIAFFLKYALNYLYPIQSSWKASESSN